jgi:hypothetical protein
MLLKSQIDGSLLCGSFLLSLHRGPEFGLAPGSSS